MLRLDGTPGPTKSYPELADFAQALVDLAAPNRQFPEKRRTEIQSLGEDFAHANWELPPGFESIRFHPLGHDGLIRWPFPKATNRVLVIPFATAGTLND